MSYKSFSIDPSDDPYSSTVLDVVTEVVRDGSHVITVRGYLNDNLQAAPEGTPDLPATCYVVRGCYGGAERGRPSIELGFVHDVFQAAELLAQFGRSTFLGRLKIAGVGADDDVSA